MFFEREKFERRSQELEICRWREMQTMEWFYVMEGANSSDEVYTECPIDFSSATIKVGDEFIGRDRYIWLQREVTLPEEKEGCRVVGYFDFGITGAGNNSGFESLLYVNGKPYQGVDTNHKEVVLTPFAGKKVCLTFLLWSGLEGGGPVRLQYHRLLSADIGYLDDSLDELYYLIKNITESLKWLSEDSTERVALVRVVEKALALIDWDADRIEETGKSALIYLRNALGAMPKNSAVTIYAVGHTHIDVCWLWRLKHTREKAQRSFSTVLRLMEEYPEYYFLQTQPQLYKFLSEDNPEIYEVLKKRVADGHWEADGGMWLEADCNLTSGESLVRQFLYGIRFYEKEFGKKCSYLWLPDVFGYSWALPQIMKLCGLNTFMTTKISWNQFNTMPNDLFWWRGIDGTEMLTYFIDVPESEKDISGTYSTYCGVINPMSVYGAWKKFKNKELSRDILMSYGYGDGGGGTTREMIENIRAINQIPGMPKLKTAKAGEFFQKIHDNIEKAESYVPIWDGELYLEYHRGTYTTQARNKWNNRKLEYALGQLEWLSVLTMVSFGCNADEKIHDCWETLLRNQFHDIIPGSSIHEVYQDTEKEYGQLWEDINEMQGEVCTRLTEEAEHVWSIFRCADVSCGEMVFIPESKEGVFYDEEGKVLPAQRVSDGWLIEMQMNSLSVESIRFVEENAETVGSPFTLNMEERVLETPFYRICWEKSGALVSLWDKENSREVLKGKGNVLRVYEDKPLAHDAWDIDIYYAQKYEDVNVQSVCCTEDGPLRMKVCFTYSYRASSINQELVVYAHNRRIDFNTKVDWHESHRLLRTLFDVDVRAVKATYDVQFGHVERPTHWNNSWDWAKFEVCGHKWADFSEGGYGVSLLNDCKYGYSIKDTVMGLSLLKSSKSPDTEADMGMHIFTYALLPHKGNLGEETITQGILLNQPSLCISGGKKAEVRQIIKKDEDSVKIDAVKLAEDGDGIVVHLHESKGCRTKIQLTSEYTFKEYACCNLLEEYEEKQNGTNICIEFKPFEIKCFRFWI